jgi:AraC family transcriptional regulator
MNKLKNGEYFGNHNQELRFNEIIITDTEYTHEKVDWHYHENPYFTYLIQGKLFEASKKKSDYLTSGSLLFHNWQDAHYNIKPPEYTRGFHIELNSEWFKRNDIYSLDFEGSKNIKNPQVKTLLNKIFLETKINDEQSQVSIELLILEIFSKIQGRKNQSKKRPKWVNTIRELITDEPNNNFSLSGLSKELNIHSAHLSRDFSKYFGTTLGEYIRLQKVNKAVLLITKNKFSLTEICYQCDFYDQSHFIANFKRIYKTTPYVFLKKISKR